MKEDRQEVAKILDDYIKGGTEALIEQLEPPELPPEYSDAEVKQAILDLEPEAYMALSQQAKDYIADFTQGRRF